MDPFSAAGLASSILTFLDFGWSVIREARTISQSASGIISSDKTIETITQDAHRLCASIASSSSPTCTNELRELVNECQAVAEELLALLRKLTLPKDTTKRSRAYKIPLLAVRRTLKKGDLDAISTRLQKVQLQLVVHMQWTLRGDNPDIAARISNIEESNRRMGIESRDQLEGMRVEIIERLGHLDAGATVGVAAIPGPSPNEHHIANADSFRASIAMKELSSRMAKLEESSQQAHKLHLLLQSLHFDAIRARHESIHEAHAKTFQWMLESDPDSPPRHTKFVDWLRGDRRIFWVRGKPGSGKSTLMKYISQHPKVPEHLLAWSSESRIITTRYFFWNSGASLEKSQEGLLRSLLFDILRSCPELVDIVEKARSSSSAPLDFNTGWSHHELFAALKAVSQARFPFKICFFIDGLDEYKGGTSELIRLIQNLVSTLDIKLCVSSRPWTEFADAFGREEDIVIKLEDLTQSDIRRYVEENLQSDQRFTALAKDKKAYKNLAEDVVSKAQGVFLWVRLAVHSLLQGARYADSLDDMRNRVEELPEDLDAFFEAIIADIPLRYLQKTALTTQLMLAAGGRLPLAAYYFIDELSVDPEYALKARIAPMSKEESQKVSEIMTARLDGRFKGLLEVHNPREDSLPAFSLVDFIHRTAKDYILFLHAVVAGWRWYVEERVMNASTPQALRDLAAMFLYPLNIYFAERNGILNWLINYLSQGSDMHKEILHRLGEGFALHIDHDGDLLGEVFLIKFLANGLSLLAPIGRQGKSDGRTVRDYIIERAIPSTPNGSELLRFLEERPGSEKISA
ncbi:hypothetical protein NPX13_g5156 [Xylaria arbuscula]|uniref:NACHT domain-containing protein n=1 Tax=Xylaria arbuscula TaxID=114810 RepID=A0A9W8NFC9_9PEZI|nr:hypothetical protein NPX13_g5156 [Xylaria arbuscula]